MGSKWKFGNLHPNELDMKLVFIFYHRNPSHHIPIPTSASAHPLRFPQASPKSPRDGPELDFCWWLMHFDHAYRCVLGRWQMFPWLWTKSSSIIAVNATRLDWNKSEANVNVHEDDFLHVQVRHLSKPWVCERKPWTRHGGRRAEGRWIKWWTFKWLMNIYWLLLSKRK